MDYPSGFRRFLQTACTATLLALGGCGGGSSDTLATVADAIPAQAEALVLRDDRARLGQQIFTDPDLSEPRGTACVACHQPNQGFAGNHGSRIGVAQGSLPTSLGLRNAMTNSYVGFIEPLSFVTTNGETEASGGHFWDGRADTLAQQALGPLLNPLEMNNPSRRAVVDKIAASRYAPLFRQQFGVTIFNDTDAAFTQIGVAIEAFERAALQPFSSKYDAMVRGTATFTPPEARGMALFMDPARANCAGCHLMNPTSGKPEDSLFSEFTYYATGIPRNTAIPRNADPAFFDLGLCGPERTAPTLPATVAAGVTIDNFCGKFRMPTLRNVAERPAYMHNGVFNNLADVVRFYSTRKSNPQRLYGPSGVPNDLPARYLGNLESTKAPFNRAPTAGPLLTEPEVADLVAFLRTLSDGFRAP
jgi:cytochrome c peroxidase